MILDFEDLEKVEQCAANNFTLREIALFLLKDYKEFKAAFQAPSSAIKMHYDKGRLESDFAAEEAMRGNAEGGNITAYQIREKKRESKDLEQLKEKLLYIE